MNKGSALERAAELVAKSDGRIMEVLEDRLHEAQKSLENMKSSKEDMGVALYELQQQAVRLKAKLESAESSLVTVQRDNDRLREQSKSTKVEAGDWQSKCVVLEKAVTQLKLEAAKSRDNIILLKETSLSLKKGLKTQKMSETSYIREVDLLKVELKNEQEAKEKLAKELARAQKDNATSLQRLELQEHETKLAQGELEKVGAEMQLLSASRTVVQKQWQAALVAMSKRDKALEEAVKKRTEFEEKYKKLLMVSGGNADTLGKLQRELDEEVARRNDAESTLNICQGKLADFQDKVKQAESALSRQVQSERSVAAQLKAKDLESNRKDFYMSQEKAKVAELELAVKVANENAARMEQEVSRLQSSGKKALERDSIRIEQAQRQTEIDKVGSSNEISRLQLERSDLQKQLEKTSQELETAERWGNEMAEEAEKIKKNSVKLEMSALRNGNRVNNLLHALEREKQKLRRYKAACGSSGGRGGGGTHQTGGDDLGLEDGTNSDDGRDEESTLAIETSGAGTQRISSKEGAKKLENQRIVALEARLANSERANKLLQKEVTTLRLHWSKAESNFISANAKLNQIKPKSQEKGMEAELIHRLHRKACDEIADLNKQNLDYQVRAGLVHLEQKRANETTIKLKQENDDLAYKLSETDAKIRAQQLQGALEIDTLRASLVQAKNANHSAVKQQFDSESKKIILQSRYANLQRKFHNTTQMLKEKEQEALTLRQRAKSLRKENTDLKKSVHALGELKRQEAIRESNKSTKRIVDLSLDTDPSKGPDTDGTTDDSGDHVNSASGRKLQQKLNQVTTKAAACEEQRVKIETQLLEEKARSQRLGQAFVERDEQCRGLISTLQETKSNLDVAEKRSTAAVSIACALEHQLNSVKASSQYISYVPQLNINPSQALLAALNQEGSLTHASDRKSIVGMGVSSPRRPSSVAKSSAPGFKRPSVTMNE